MIFSDRSETKEWLNGSVCVDTGGKITCGMAGRLTSGACQEGTDGQGHGTTQTRKGGKCIGLIQLKGDHPNINVIQRY